MVTYSEAKKIALARAENAGVSINWVGELPHAYIFDDSTMQYDGLLPFVVRKKDGKVFNSWHYMNKTKSNWNDVKEIEF